MVRDKSNPVHALEPWRDGLTPMSQQARDMRRRRTDEGQTLVLVALGMVALLGFVGLAFDLGNLRLQKRQLQLITDAAALAGAQELTYCTSSACSAMTTAAQNALTENGVTGNTLVTQCSSGTGSFTLTLNNPPCALGTSNPHNGDRRYVEVVVQRSFPTYFARVFGINSQTISARAEATLPGGSSCVFALDTSGTAINLAFGNFTSQCGVVDESKSKGFFLWGYAFSCLAGTFDAPYIGVVGSSLFWCNTGGGASPRNGIAVPNPADPLAYMQSAMASAAPSPSSCGSTPSSPYTGHNGAITITGTATLNQGTYCGGITIRSGARVTFNPGIYTLTSKGSSGGLSIDPAANVTGNGVAFYNYGPSGDIDIEPLSMAANSVTLTAPTSGAFSGILFFQDPGNTTAAKIVGASNWNTKLTGGYYFPNANITFALDYLVDYDIIVAQDITLGFSFQSIPINSNFYNNYSSLVNGTPIKSNVATLSE